MSKEKIDGPRPRKIFVDIRNQLKVKIEEAKKQTAEQQIQTLGDALNLYKEAIKNAQESIKNYKPFIRKQEGKIFSDPNLQKLARQVTELALEARKLHNQAKEKVAGINNTIDKVDQILLGFLDKTNKIGKNFPEAITTAEGLYKDLLKYRNTYEKNLKDGTMNESEAGKIFKDACSVAITKAMPILERALGWGEYLKNLIKTIANAVLYVVTAGNKSSFFPYSKSTISESAAQASKHLQHHDKEEPKNTEVEDNQQSQTPTLKG